MIPPDLLGAVFDAAVDDRALQLLTATITQAFESVSATLQTYGSDRAEMLSYSGFDASLIDQQVAYYWRVDPWVAGYKAHAQEGFLPSSMMISDDEMLRSELYNDLFRHHDDQFRCAAFMEPLSAGEFLCFGVHRRRNDADFEGAAVGLGERLRPLLIQMVRARRRRGSGRGALAERVVDADADAVALVRADGRLVFANAAAVRALEGGPLRKDGDRLAAHDPVLGRALHQAVKAACSGLGGRVLDSATTDLRIAVDPLQDGASGPGAGGPAPLALVRVRDEAARREAALSAAAAALALTPAERGLASALLRGVAPADHARARAVSITTVRTQLRSLYAKAGVGTRAELMLALGL